LLSKPDYYANTSLIYYFGRMLSTRQFFFMTDGTMKQLKNSGGLRLIRQQDVVDSLQAYDNLYSLFIQNQQLEELQLIDYRSVLVKLFDARILEPMTKDNLVFHLPEGNPPLFNKDKALLNELMVRVHFIKRNITNNYNYLKLLNQKGTRIIELIKEKYHLE